MAAFAIVSTVPNEALGAEIATAYETTHLVLSNSTWLIADTGRTSQEVSEHLKIKAGGFSNVLVLRIETYFGFASPAIWEWLKVKGAEP